MIRRAAERPELLNELKSELKAWSAETKRRAKLR